ncbi:MAG: LptF/LptG family permease, partial [Rickettsiales bacterium]|nr:LptF/LptG family permease [Rickettsiales bacterium]
MRATLIDRYLVKRILVMFAFVACILVLALSLERLLRLVDEVTTSGAPILQAFLLLFYLQPHYLGLTIPAALFLSVILTVRRLHEQSEMVIFYASGRSLFRTLLPILALAGALAGVLLFLVSIAQPYSRYAFRAEYHTVRQTQQQVQLRPHAFQRLGERLVLRIEAVEGENPATIRGFFSEAKDKDGSRTIISADSATVTMLPGQPVSLQLHDGSIIKQNAEGKAQFIAFN